MTVESYAAAKRDVLYRRLAFQANRARRQGDADAVHDLRVALRRLEECERIFRPLLRVKRSKKQRGRMRSLLKAAGKVRNADIALELLRESKCDASGLQKRFQKERDALRREMKCLA